MDECQEFSGARQSSGYGNVWRDGKYWLAHRWAWTEKNGVIPKGLQVLHKCDNRRCINPEHLFLGTPKDNTQDMIKKGRSSFYMTTNPPRDWHGILLEASL